LDLPRLIAGIMTLCMITTLHLIGFNNIRVLDTFWLPELILLIYLVYSIIPVEKVLQLTHDLKKRLTRSERDKKVVHLRKPKKKRLPLLTVLDGVLVTLAAALALLIVYRL